MEQKVTKKKWLQVEDIVIAYQHLKDIVTHTPLQKNERLSEKYNCNVYLKREDLQVVRSFKLRGAYYAMKMLPQEKLVKWRYLCKCWEPCSRCCLCLSSS